VSVLHVDTPTTRGLGVSSMHQLLQDSMPTAQRIILATGPYHTSLHQTRLLVPVGHSPMGQQQSSTDDELP